MEEKKTLFEKTLNILKNINPEDPEFKKVEKILTDGIGYMRQRGIKGEVDIVRYDSL